MIAGASWEWWIGFHAAVGLLLLAGALLPGHSEESRSSLRVQWLWTAVLVLVAAGFAAWVAVTQGRQTALEFVAGYGIETSLSLDNLFVFLVIFQGFHISRARQQQALGWGIMGAVVLRAAFILAGVALISRFEWVSWVFGVLLLYAAWRLVRGGSARAAVPEWVKRMHPAGGSLLPVIVAVELTDVLFAVDSIPAVLSISHNPFVVYTSNIAAILGLRSLYFVLADMLGRLRYLHYGLGALLGFAALKMIAARWFDVPIGWSLGVIAGILVVCGAASWAAGTRD